MGPCITTHLCLLSADEARTFRNYLAITDISSLLTHTLYAVVISLVHRKQGFISEEYTSTECQIGSKDELLSGQVPGENR